MNWVFYRGSMEESGVAGTVLRQRRSKAPSPGQLPGSAPQPQGVAFLTFCSDFWSMKHNLPSVGLGNISGSREITAAEICALPSLLIKSADETFVCQGWMFS